MTKWKSFLNKLRSLLRLGSQTGTFAYAVLLMCAQFLPGFVHDPLDDALPSLARLAASMAKLDVIAKPVDYALLIMPWLVALCALFLPRKIRWLGLLPAVVELAAVLTVVACSSRTYIGMVRPHGEFFLLKPAFTGWVVIALACIMFMSVFAWACKSEYEPD
ncbi:hypothetical protein [Lacticaseibacillus zhaodongensis]|uniref:hypothetical protein n=1 Tax=Lacticaseibacillus zhaodongensis TaxID=2668065 RepID=UPI0012D36736|nr:hypothetical protein [Lacticaseibacillus zhaodongensis]